MVEALMDRYMLPHAASFYLDLFDGMREGSALKAVADIILSRGLTVVKHRDITGNKGTRETANLTKQQSETVFNLLETFGWVQPAEQTRHDSKPWAVNPRVHSIFAERAAATAAKRAEQHAALRSLGRS